MRTAAVTRRRRTPVPPQLFALAALTTCLDRETLSMKIAAAITRVDRFLPGIYTDAPADDDLTGHIMERFLEGHAAPARWREELPPEAADLVDDAFLLGLAFAYRALQAKGGAS